MVINDYITGLCIYHTIFFTIILDCTFSTYRKIVNYKIASGRAFRRHPEESIVIGDDSFLCAITPENLLGGQDVEAETMMVMILTLYRPRVVCVFVSWFLIKFWKVKKKS